MRSVGAAVEGEFSLVDMDHLQCSQQMVYSAFTMAGASYLPWMAGALTERPGEGYWLSFNQRLPISYKLGDHLTGLLYLGQLV